MKIGIKKFFKEITADKHLLAVILTVLLLVIVATIIIGLSLQVRELKMPFRYSSFGTTTIYFNRWFYSLNFLIFNIIVFIFHTILASKFYQTGNRVLAFTYLWLGFGVVFFNLVVSLLILNIQRVL